LRGYELHPHPNPLGHKKLPSPGGREHKGGGTNEQYEKRSPMPDVQCPMPNLILIGYRAAGKTAVGKRLAEKLGLPFCDTDEMISRRTGKSVRDIVAEKGWEVFRREEKIVIRGLTFMQGSVIALGGGALMNPANLEMLKGKGVFIWLTADAATIVERMETDEVTREQRPPLTNGDPLGETAAMLKEREPVYRVVSDLMVDTAGRNIEDLTDEIIRRVEEKGK
jgi:shikimate kinase